MIILPAATMNEDIGEIKVNYLCVESSDLVRRNLFTVDGNKNTINKGYTC